MISKNIELVNLKGSSLTFPAHGWWGKEKNLSARKSVRQKFLFPSRPRKNTAKFPQQKIAKSSLVRRAGFEPATISLKGCCSTD